MKYHEIMYFAENKRDVRASWEYGTGYAASPLMEPGSVNKSANVIEHPLT